MTAPRLPAFDPDTQPILLKMSRRLEALRRIKSMQGQQHAALDAQLSLLSRKAATLFKNKGEAKQLDLALRMATEFAFERIIENTITLALTDPPASGQTVSIGLLMMKNGQHVVSAVEAQLGENGWLSCKFPIGQDYDVALLVGKSLGWCQLGNIHRLTDETDTHAVLGNLSPGKDVILDRMRHHAENIYELEEEGLLYIPASARHGSRGSAVVIFRPLIVRERLRVTQN